MDVVIRVRSQVVRRFPPKEVYVGSNPTEHMIYTG